MVVVALPLLYGGAYLAMLKPSTFFSAPGDVVVHRDAAYRFGGDTAAVIFAPANWVDRKLRPSYWPDVPAGDGATIYFIE